MVFLVIFDVTECYALLNPAHALHGGVSYFAFVCVCVCVCVCVRACVRACVRVCSLTNYLKKY